jgi:exportin-1
MVYEGIGHMIKMEVNPVNQEILVNNELQYVHHDWL